MSSGPTGILHVNRLSVVWGKGMSALLGLVTMATVWDHCGAVCMMNSTPRSEFGQFFMGQNSPAHVFHVLKEPCSYVSLCWVNVLSQLGLHWIFMLYSPPFPSTGCSQASFLHSSLTCNSLRTLTYHHAAGCLSVSYIKALLVSGCVRPTTQCPSSP